MKSPDLIIFAKQPIPGQVKTRLQADYSVEQMLAIAKFLIRSTVELAVNNWPSEVYLYGAPDANHPLFHELAKEFRIHLAAQIEGDLGQRMLCALREGIARKGAAGILGCDVPHCRGTIIEQAHEQLAEGHNVIGLTEDGGYYFIGMQRAQDPLFEAVEWGGNNVAETTLDRAQRLGMEFELLPKLRDIDTGEDLWIIGQEYEPLRRHLYRVLADLPLPAGTK
ncbi:MAG: TIGR04282 family arsenosugar biosynthesis glycosyltransferase [Acidiferrobacterales bacterium]